MEYYVVSPNVFNDGRNHSEEMFNLKIAAVGWDDDSPKGQQFANIKVGDCIIVALRKLWQWSYFYLGIVSENVEEPILGNIEKKLSPIVDLKNIDLGFDGWSSNGSNQIPAIQRIKEEEQNQLIINKIQTIIGMQKYIDILTTNHNLILTGAPGTGKTYLAKQIAQQMIFGSVKEEKDFNDDEKNQFNKQCGFVQFHPSYDYTDFVEGLRPIQDDNGNVGFERKDGVFKEFCIKALNNPNKNYIFIIDEINRGEISKIFGELFFSIDPGYRGEKGKVRTQYANMQTVSNDFDDKLGITDDNNFGHFFVPENVYIIGTMNDIDRSVESMDFAFRRRFAFKEIKAEDRVDMIKENETLSPHFDDIEKRMRNLNNCILSIQGLGSAYQIGASYFLKLENYLVNGQLKESSWNGLWDNHISGLLFDYLRVTPNAATYLDELKKSVCETR